MDKRDKLLQIRVSQKEKEIITNNADLLKMTVTNYLRLVAKNPTIVEYDYGIIHEHTREIGEIRKAINRLIWTIEFTNNYLPNQIDFIVKMMQDIFNLKENSCVFMLSK